MIRQFHRSLAQRSSRRAIPPLFPKWAAATPTDNNNNNNHRTASASSSPPPPASSSSSQPPLFLWVGSSSSSSSSSSPSVRMGNPSQQQQQKQRTRRAPLLLPVVAPTEATVTDASDFVHVVHQHYSAEQSFVGGMGESDPGVFVAVAAMDQTDGVDTLDYLALIVEGIDLVKQQRHGVSLFAGTPRDYQQATGQDYFGQVCGFIASAAELGIAVEVSVMRKHAAAAQDLALSLGARHVHMY